jgi:hypothetical protein
MEHPIVRDTATVTPEIDEFDPADFVTDLHDEGLWPINAGGDPQVPDNTLNRENEDINHLTVYAM